jgi:hypothetical protein
MSLQSAALAYRISGSQELEVLLVTSRRGARWRIPRVKVKCGRSARSCADQDAFREAGVFGKIAQDPLVRWFRKPAPFRADLPVKVIEAYALAVETEAPCWPDMHRRQRSWMSLKDAIHAVNGRRWKRMLRLLGQSNPAMKTVNHINGETT